MSGKGQIKKENPRGIINMLLEKLKTDVITAMKAKDETRVSTLRFLLSALNNKQIELQKELTEEDVIGVIAKQVKERKESIEAFTTANRQDLVDKEKHELEILVDGCAHRRHHPD